MAGKVFLLLAVIAVSLHSSLATAVKNIQADQICITESGIEPVLRPAPVPVGCELIDCCPGCPPAKSLEWRINVDTKVLDGIELRFDAPSADFLKSLQISGNAKLDGDRVIVGRGNSTIKSVPVGSSDNVAVGLVTPFAGKEAPARLSNISTASESITVQQILGSLPVNTFRWQLTTTQCVSVKTARAAKQDRLKVPAVPSGDTVAVMMDSRTSPGANGCSNDKMRLSGGDSPVGNNRASAGCNSEIAVFGVNNRMLLESPVTTWTDNATDVHSTPPLGSPIPVPVMIWTANSAMACDRIRQEHLANANYIYKNNKVGVRFDPTPACQDVSGNPAAVTEIMKGLGTPGPGGAVACADLAAVRASGYYAAGQLNVYYVIGDFTGRSCAIRTTPEDTILGDGNIIYLGSGPAYPPNLATLAHEFGHAFGLRPADHGPTWQGGGHVNPNGTALPGFDTTNVMWGGGPPTRDRFKVGQVFRMNEHTDRWGGTMLIKNGLRPGPGRPCHPLADDPLCPKLGVAWP